MSGMSVGECARRLGTLPRHISNGLYFGTIDDTFCPLVGGRRIIQEEAIPVIRAALLRRGLPVRDDTRAEGVPHA